MKIVICGGHLTPALSVIEELSDKNEIYYFGRKFPLEGDKATSLEYRTITEIGIPFVDIKTGRIQRRFTRYTIPSLVKIPRGFAQSLSQLSKIKPDIVVGFGGYVSIPVCFAARALNIPVLIHEQTLEAGGANKLIAKIAAKVCISFESSKKFFPVKKTVLTGNPIRKGLLNPTKKFQSILQSPIIYITGGSLGSHAINDEVLNSLDKLLQKYSIVHQTGWSEKYKDYDKLVEAKEKLSDSLKNKYIVEKFFNSNETGELLKISDLIIGRAGINTVSELILFEKPALLIPLPITQRNEQQKNALLIKDIGLGEVIEQKDLSVEKFLEKIDYMIENSSKYKINKQDNLFPKDSARKIVEEIYAIAKTSN